MKFLEMPFGRIPIMKQRSPGKTSFPVCFGILKPSFTSFHIAHLTQCRHFETLYFDLISKDVSSDRNKKEGHDPGEGSDQQYFFNVNEKKQG